MNAFQFMRYLWQGYGLRKKGKLKGEGRFALHEKGLCAFLMPRGAQKENQTGRQGNTSEHELNCRKEMA